MFFKKSNTVLLIECTISQSVWAIVFTIYSVQLVSTSWKEKLKQGFFVKVCIYVFILKMKERVY